MISISIEGFFTLLICGTTIGIGILWARQHIIAMTHNWQPSEYKICQCPKCKYDFFIKPRKALVVCPACKENVRVRAPDKHLRY